MKSNNDYGALLREAVDTMRSADRVSPLSPEGLREIISEQGLFRSYVALLSEGMTPDSAESFAQLCNNYQTGYLSESVLSGVQPISVLALPMLRRAWPAIGVKEALPTEVVKTPKFTIGTLVPYIVDPATGVKRELPMALANKSGNTRPGSSQLRCPTAAQTLPLNAADQAPVGTTAAAGYTLDPVFAVTAVDIIVTNAAGASPETKTNVKVFDGRAETRQGMIRFSVTAAHSGGHETSDMVMGYVDFANMTLTMTSMTAAADEDHAQITKVYVSGKIESTANLKSTHIGYDIRNDEIHIGTGEHFDASLPIEWLQDNLAMYNIDGTLRVVDIMTEVVAQNVDVEGIEFLQAAHARAEALGGSGTYERTFNVHPTGKYTGSPTDWLNELKRVTDNLAQDMRNQSNFAGGKFVIIGNPVDVNLYVGVNWMFTMQGDQQRDSVDVTYNVGAMSGAQTYSLVSSQNFPAGTMYIFLIPKQEDHKTVMYYPYAFNVERTSAGFVNPNQSNTPGIMMTKRHRFWEFMPLVGTISVLNNDGTLPA